MILIPVCGTSIFRGGGGALIVVLTGFRLQVQEDPCKPQLADQG